MAVLLPMERERRQLRPLANTSRLTRLPEYARLARTRSLSTVVAIVLLVLLFGAAVLASARPSGWWWSLDRSDAPEDIMLCVAEPVTDQATADFLGYFAQQVRTYGTQRVGLTSLNRRVVPMTRDYQYAAAKFDVSADLAGMQDDADLPPTQQAALRNAIAAFSAPVSYVDYAPSVADVLALCMTGFPNFETTSTHRRSMIYLGPGEIRLPDETRPSLYSDQQVTEMASKADIQINALASSTPGALRSVVDSTGGHYFSIDPGHAELGADLDVIRSHPPDSGEAGGATVTGLFGDSPTIPLSVGVVIATLLCLSLVVLRR